MLIATAPGGNSMVAIVLPLGAWPKLVTLKATYGLGKHLRTWGTRLGVLPWHAITDEDELGTQRVTGEKEKQSTGHYTPATHRGLKLNLSVWTKGYPASRTLGIRSRSSGRGRSPAWVTRSFRATKRGSNCPPWPETASSRRVEPSTAQLAQPPM
jgi:hypothetical protein